MYWLPSWWSHCILSSPPPSGVHFARLWHQPTLRKENWHLALLIPQPVVVQPMAVVSTIARSAAYPNERWLLRFGFDGRDPGCQCLVLGGPESILAKIDLHQRSREALRKRAPSLFLTLKRKDAGLCRIWLKRGIFPVFEVPLGGCMYLPSSTPWLILNGMFRSSPSRLHIVALNECLPVVVRDAPRETA